MAGCRGVDWQYFWQCSEGSDESRRGRVGMKWGRAADHVSAASCRGGVMAARLAVLAVALQVCQGAPWPWAGGDARRGVRGGGSVPAEGHADFLEVAIRQLVLGIEDELQDHVGVAAQPVLRDRDLAEDARPAAGAQA